MTLRMTPAEARRLLGTKILVPRQVRLDGFDSAEEARFSSDGWLSFADWIGWSDAKIEQVAAYRGAEIVHHPEPQGWDTGTGRYTPDFAVGKTWRVEVKGSRFQKGYTVSINRLKQAAFTYPTLRWALAIYERGCAVCGNRALDSDSGILMCSFCGPTTTGRRWYFTEFYRGPNGRVSRRTRLPGAGGAVQHNQRR